MIAKTVAVCTLVGMLFGAWFFIDGRYAKCGEVSEVKADIAALAKTFRVKSETDLLNQKQDRLWKLEDRYGSDPDKVPDPTIRQHMKELKADVESQRGKVRTLEGK